MSVWDNYSQPVRPPEGTPDIRIRQEYVQDGIQTVVYADGDLVHSTQHYQDAHRWVMNTYRLSRTMMLPIYEEFTTQFEKSSLALEGG